MPDYSERVVVLNALADPDAFGMPLPSEEPKYERAADVVLRYLDANGYAVVPKAS